MSRSMDSTLTGGCAGVDAVARSGVATLVWVDCAPSGCRVLAHPPSTTVTPAAASIARRNPLMRITVVPCIAYRTNRLGDGRWTLRPGMNGSVAHVSPFSCQPPRDYAHAPPCASRRRGPAVACSEKVKILRRRVTRSTAAGHCELIAGSRMVGAARVVPSGTREHPCGSPTPPDPAPDNLLRNGTGIRSSGGIPSTPSTGRST